MDTFIYEKLPLGRSPSPLNLTRVLDFFIYGDCSVQADLKHHNSRAATNPPRKDADSYGAHLVKQQGGLGMYGGGDS